MRREFSAGGVLVRRMQGRWWLAAISPRRDDARVVWALPKGLIDTGERGQDTAIREVHEETGVEGRVERNVKTLMKWAARDNDRTMLYSAELKIKLGR